MSAIEDLQSRIEPLRTALLSHPLYRRMQSIDALRLFMEHHVFPVWDFMSLLKFLQIKLCCVTVPWVPSRHPQACRFINEIVLGEESDETGQGGFSSHFEMYRSAMQQCGASTKSIDEFLESLASGSSLEKALSCANVSAPAQNFVKQTFQIIESGDLCAVAAAFTFGREDLLPGVFRRIVEELNQETQGQLDSFRFYLDRHIELDGDDHGPMATQLLVELCGTDESKWQRAEHAAVTSLQSRLNLWDAVASQLPD